MIKLLLHMVDSKRPYKLSLGYQDIDCSSFFYHMESMCILKIIYEACVSFALIDFKFKIDYNKT